MHLRHFPTPFCLGEVLLYGRASCKTPAIVWNRGFSTEDCAAVALYYNCAAFIVLFHVFTLYSFFCICCVTNVWMMRWLDKNCILVRPARFFLVSWSSLQPEYRCTERWWRRRLQLVAQRGTVARRSRSFQVLVARKKKNEFPPLGQPCSPSSWALVCQILFFFSEMMVRPTSQVAFVQGGGN